MEGRKNNRFDEFFDNLNSGIDSFSSWLMFIVVICVGFFVLYEIIPILIAATKH
jgi:hypothetical protein